MYMYVLWLVSPILCFIYGVVHICMYILIHAGVVVEFVYMYNVFLSYTGRIKNLYIYLAIVLHTVGGSMVFS